MQLLIGLVIIVILLIIGYFALANVLAGKNDIPPPPPNGGGDGDDAPIMPVVPQYPNLDPEQERQAQISALTSKLGAAKARLIGFKTKLQSINVSGSFKPGGNKKQIAELKEKIKREEAIIARIQQLIANLKAQSS